MKTLLLKVKVNNDYEKDIVNAIENITIVDDVDILEVYED